MSFHVSPDVTL